MCNLLTYWLDKNLILKYKIFDDAIFDTLFDIINKGTNLANLNNSSDSQAKIKRNLISIGDKLESLISTKYSFSIITTETWHENKNKILVRRNYLNFSIFATKLDFRG